MSKSYLKEEIENIFKQLGGFTWDQAEVWAGFCKSVGMDPVPYLKVMLTNLCDVKTTMDKSKIPSDVYSPELWILDKGFRSEFIIKEPTGPVDFGI